jgi:hypothetical protein
VPHEQQRMRGHGALLAACDSTLRVEKLSTTRAATLEKSNDAAEGAKLAFTLASIELHRDADTGQVTTAPVVEAVDATSEEPSPTRKLSDRQRVALEVLADSTIEKGEKPPADFGLPNGLLAVKIADWRAEIYRRGIIDRDAPNPREDFKRVKIALAARHLIGERDGLVWRVK